jgi:hypothetical protein
MPHFSAPSRCPPAPALFAALLLSLVSGCASMSPTAPAHPQVDGSWQLDRSASDLVDTKVAQAIAAWQARLRKHYGDRDLSAGNTGPVGGANGGRHGGQGGGNPDGSSSGQGEYQYSGEDFDAFRPLGPDFGEVRRRLLLVLTPPVSLKLTAAGEVVRIAPGNVPPSDYHTDEEFSRIDEYGVARIDAGWAGDAFELQARYSSHATLVEHFEVDPHTGTLTVSYHLHDPMVGKIDLNSVYRRD